MTSYQCDWFFLAGVWHAFASGPAPNSNCVGVLSTGPWLKEMEGGCFPSCQHFSGPRLTVTQCKFHCPGPRFSVTQCKNEKGHYLSITGPLPGELRIEGVRGKKQCHSFLFFPGGSLPVWFWVTYGFSSYN